MCVPFLGPAIATVFSTIVTGFGTVGTAVGSVGGALGLGGATAGAVAVPAGAGAGIGGGAIGTAALTSQLAIPAAAGATGLSASSLFTIGAGLSTIGSFASFIQQTQNAKRQAKFARENQELQDELAKADAILSYDSLNARIAEERTRAGVEAQRVTRESRRAIGVARATGSNVAGAAIDNLVRDFELKAEEFRTGTFGNLRLTEAQIAREKKGVELRATGRSLAGRAAPIERPSFLGAGLRAGAGVFDAATLTTFIGPGGTRRFGIAA